MSPFHQMVIKNVFVATLVFSGWVLDRIRIRGTQENEEDELVKSYFRCPMCFIEALGQDNYPTRKIILRQ